MNKSIAAKIVKIADKYYFVDANEWEMEECDFPLDDEGNIVDVVSTTDLSKSKQRAVLFEYNNNVLVRPKLGETRPMEIESVELFYAFDATLFVEAWDEFENPEKFENMPIYSDPIPAQENGNYIISYLFDKKSDI